MEERRSAQRFYFPVLRGKQYELLALREMASDIATKNKIRPVIEPLTIQASAIALDKFTERSMPFCLIVNPREGSLSSLSLHQMHQNLVLPYADDDLFIPTLYVDGDTTTSDIAEFAALYTGERAFFAVSDPRSAVVSAMKSASPSYVLLLKSATSASTQSAFPPAICVDITEPFKRLPRNKDYKDQEFFSDRHLTTPDASFAHFGDYSIIGQQLSEGGPAYCVAIHMVYALSAADRRLWIKHYKSTSNSTPTDPGGKFIEAVTKLADEWPALDPINHTQASQRFIDYAKTAEYPGLGKVKQISIMHHLELMQDKLL